MAALVGQVLHLEANTWAGLPWEPPCLPCLRVLSIDWRVLFSSLHKLEAMSALETICISDFHPPFDPEARLRAGPADVLASLATLPALRRVMLVVTSHPQRSLEVTQVLVGLAGIKPGLQVEVRDAEAFFLEVLPAQVPEGGAVNSPGHQA